MFVSIQRRLVVMLWQKVQILNCKHF